MLVTLNSLQIILVAMSVMFSECVEKVPINHFVVEIMNYNNRLDEGGFSKCTGTVISTRWVLTSANCVRNSNRLRNIIIRIPFPNRIVEVIEVEVLKGFGRIHEKLDIYENDLAILKLKAVLPNYHALNFSVDVKIKPIHKWNTDSSSTLHFINSRGTSYLDRYPLVICATPTEETSFNYRSQFCDGAPVFLQGEVRGILSTVDFKELRFNSKPPIIFTNIYFEDYSEWITSEIDNQNRRFVIARIYQPIQTIDGKIHSYLLTIQIP